MAVIQVEFQSETLKRRTAFQAILPIESAPAPYQALYLLHGLTDNSKTPVSVCGRRKWDSR